MPKSKSKRGKRGKEQKARSAKRNFRNQQFLNEAKKRMLSEFKKYQEANMPIRENTEEE